MNEPVVFKSSLTIAILTFVRTITPALVAIGMLYGIARAYLIPFDSHFGVMAVLVAILGPVVMHMPPVSAQQFVARGWSTVGRLVLRWMVLIAILLSIGYVTKFSGEFSRRVVLTWIVLTPVPLILAMVALNHLMRRLMYAPSNARSAVFAGYNEVSVSLEERLTKHPELCIRVAGYFDDRSPERLGAEHGARLLGGLADLLGLARLLAAALPGNPATLGARACGAAVLRGAGWQRGLRLDGRQRCCQAGAGRRPRTR